MGKGRKPDISIVIPSFNQAAFLPETLDSILSQADAPTMQVVVVDGGSTDGTLEILESLDDPRVEWISEPDRGQAHAINKGMALAGGVVVGWLNSDDTYAPGALRAVVDAFEENPGANWLAGRVTIVDGSGSETRRAITRYKDRRLRRYTFRGLLRENFISQMGVFWRCSFARELGPLDESLVYTMDYDYWLRMGARCDPLVLDKVLARFRWHAGSKSGAVDRSQFDEQYRVACKHPQADRAGRLAHRFNVEKIVWSYRLLKLLGR